MSTSKLRGLYCITDPQLAQQSNYNLEEMVGQAIDGGARLIQYRDKTASPTTQRETARALARLCQERDVLFLVNDDPELARFSEADGVHIGQADAALAEARRILGSEKLIGVSCHGSLALAVQAQAQGADYVAFGRFFPSHSKPEALPAPAELLARARPLIRLPIVAIGGIDAKNALPLLEQGADMLAVIHAVFGQRDMRAAAAEIAQLFNRHAEPA